MTVEYDKQQEVIGQQDEPLTMTVHTMPGYTRGSIDDARRKRKGRWMGLFILLACLAPVIASYLMFYVVKPSGNASSYGTLVPPAEVTEMPSVQGVLPDGSSVDVQSLRRQWLLVVVAGGACDARCEKLLYLQRQIREMTGKYKERVDRVWLVSDDQAIKPALLPAFEDPYAQVLRLPESVIERWMQPADGQVLQDHLYVVDPMGRWMMRFPADLEPRKAKKDLDVLLKASKSWDRDGRDTL